MAKLTCGLSIREMQKMIDDIEVYKQSITRKTELLVQQLSMQGVVFAKAEIQNLDAVFTGELLDSVHSEYRTNLKNGAIYAFVADCEHAAFVEFGTGYIGQSNPYFPLPVGVKWDYIVGRQILANARKGIYGWFYKRDDGQVYFTEGMESRPFMTRAAFETLGVVKEVALRVFKDGQ